LWPLDPRIYRHRISIFGGFWRRTCTKATCTHQKNWNKILSCAFQMSLQKLGYFQHEEKCECMRRWTQRTFPTLNITMFFVFWFQCNLFFDKLNMCQEWVAWLFDHPVDPITVFLV
jgi:hypothetical protein